MDKMRWEDLLSQKRRKDLAKPKNSSADAGKPEHRTETERDYDRVLFSTPVRRLADKTQVFPLDKNDSVRTRLTHSHEVSNLARSIAIALVHGTDVFDGVENANRNVPAMAAVIGLAHDIGNPPFGHQGERAIGKWFEKNEKRVFQVNDPKADGYVDAPRITPAMKQDYFKFEGNAQALRILTKLQTINDKFGLNLTCGSLAALMKYPCYSDKVSKKNVATKKFGAFHSETDVCEDIWKQTGLEIGVRHPLAYVMEAADDIAYAVLDAEDAVKKKLVSFQDLIEFLSISEDTDDAGKQIIVNRVVCLAKAKHREHHKEKLSPDELNDISMQRFRVFAIGELVTAVINSFQDNLDKILAGNFEGDLIEASDASLLCEKLKNFSRRHAFSHKSVLELELNGYNTIQSIMDMLWPSIVSKGDPMDEFKSDTSGPFEKYAYGRISENYRRVFEDKENKLPLEYKRAQLLADMVSGMTDSFAIDFEKDLKKYQ